VRVPDVRPFPDGHDVNISLSKEFLVRNLILLPPLQCGVGAALIILDGEAGHVTPNNENANASIVCAHPNRASGRQSIAFRQPGE
jgi:hypothetical protein